MKKTILCLILFQIYIQSCTPGCLKCNKDSQCLICDVTNQYKLSFGSCIKSQEQNCYFQDIGGYCVQCLPSFFLDSTNQKCVKVSNEEEIQRCENYDSSQNCRNCQLDYYLDSGKCLLVNKPIAHCEKYTTNQICSECTKSFLVNMLGNKCEPKSAQIQNCHNWTQIYCNKCENGYIKNPNNYFNEIFQFTNLNKIQNLLEFLQDFKFGFQKMRFFPICQKMILTNCKEYLTYNFCKICENGYYLEENGSCQLNPKEKIENCVYYSSATSCLECDQGYYLNQKICAPVQQILNCSKYNSKFQNTNCISCSEDFYLVQQVCKQRKISKGENIEFCIIKTKTEDNCEMCDEKYILTSDKIKCLEKIQKCLIHSPIGSNAIQANCSQCIDGCFLNQNSICQQGSISNCKVYSSSNFCAICENQYYLFDSQTCKKSFDIENCKIYDGSSTNKPNSCISCINNSFSFKIKQYCKNVQIIPNCKIYKQSIPSSCLECFEGFFLDNQQCLSFNDFNCAKGTTRANCTHCKKNYALYQIEGIWVCRTPLNYLISNCSQHSAKVQNSLTIQEVICNYCDFNYFPRDYSEGYICLEEEYKLLEGITSSNFVLNCKKYDINRKCEQCALGYFLKEINSLLVCVENCGSSYAVKVQEIIDNENGFKIGKVNQCVPSNDCAKIAPQVFNFYTSNGPLFSSSGNSDFNHICIYCVENKAAVISSIYEDSHSNINVNSNKFFELVLDPQDWKSKVTCVTPSKINDVTTTYLIKNCEYYLADSQNQQSLFCVKCQKGFHGRVKKGASNLGYISSCDEMATCDIDFQYYGLLPVYANLLSCTKCLDSNQIPFLGLMMNNSLNEYTIVGLQPFDIKDQNYPAFETGQEEKSVLCLNPSQKSNFGIENKTTNIPNNCGVAVLNIGTSDGDASGNNVQVDYLSQNIKLAYFCGQCKPGYKPVYLHPDRPYIVVSCDKISNCMNSNGNDQKYFNQCSQCQNGFTFLYQQIPTIGQNSIDFSSCIENSVQNCVASSIQDFFNKCELCNRGYILNKDNICEEIISPQCTSSLNSVLIPHYVKYNMLNHLLYLTPAGNGCISCATGQISIKKLNVFQCTLSTFIQQNFSNFVSLNGQQSFYINFCEGYGYDEMIVCKKCSEGYILNKNGTKCTNTIANCKIASSLNSEHCAQCLDGFALINNYCQIGNILNCQSYFTQISKNQMECSICDNGYFKDLNNYQCKKGSIQHCQLFRDNSNIKCEFCDAGFSIIKKVVDICYPMKSDLNCDTSTLGNEVSCTSCKLPNQILLNLSLEESFNEKQSICMPYLQIVNCIEYDVQNELQFSSFQCTLCKKEYYIKEFECFPRQIFPENCAEFEPKEDKCQICSANHFLTNSGKNCEEFPFGILGCRIYSKKNICIGCKSNRYLENNLCKEVPINNLIEFCLYYISLTNCAECLNGYILIDSKCLQANVQNCSTYSSVDSCASCLSTFGLSTDLNKTNCITVNKPNCIEFEPTGNFRCLLCADKYYPNEEGECFFANTQITGCLKYKSLEECSLCESDKVLSQNGKECFTNQQLVSKIDQNCQDTRFIETPICSVCSPGFMFENGKCVSCEKGATFQEGCFSCNPENKKNCLICKENYYMDKNGLCLNNLGNQEEDNVLVSFTQLIVVNFLILMLNQLEFQNGINQIFF